MKNFTLIFFIFAFLFAVPQASAAPADPTAAAESKLKEIVNRTPDPENDYADKWFSQIFGNFIFAPWLGDGDAGASSATLVSKVVGFTNILALALGVVIIYYVFIGGAINAAGKGEAMGQNWSGTWMPIRTIIGFGLIMPVSGIGGGVLSISQIFILWVIMLGSNAATSLWTTVGNELISTNSVHITNPGILLEKSQVTELSKMMYCSILNVKASKRNGGSGEDFATFEYNSIHVFDVSTSVDSVNFSSMRQKDKADLTNIQFGDDGKCGNYSFPLSNSSQKYARDYKNEAKNLAVTAGTEAILDIMDEIKNEIKKLVAQDQHKAAIISNVLKYIKSSSSTEPSPDEMTWFTELGYNKIVANMTTQTKKYSEDVPETIHNTITQNDQIQSKFKGEIIKGGWGGAGIWFYEISAISSLSHKITNKFATNLKAPAIEFCPDHTFLWFDWTDNTCDEYTAEYQSGLILLEEIMKDVIKSSGNVSINDEINMSCNGQSSCSVDTNVNQKLATSLATSILNVHVDPYDLDDKSWYEVNANSQKPIGEGNQPIHNPFLTISAIGNQLNSYASTAYITGMALTAIFGGEDKDAGMLQKAGTKLMEKIPAGKVASAIMAVGNGIKRVVKTWIIPTLMAVIMSLMALGFTLAYVIPFMPIITWTLMIVGYLVTVIEALIAAPLAVIMMVIPEGEGIAGTRLERAMQLIATAVLKPSLMVIGLIASITVGFVAFQIWNEFFFKTAEHILTGSMFDLIAVLTIYTNTSFLLCKLIIGVMHRLPNQILEWFSSGVSRPFGEDTAEQGAEKAAGAIKDGVQGIGSSLGKVVQGERDAKKNARAMSAQRKADAKNED